MKLVDYKCFYKPESTVWKHFYFEAKSDQEAIEIVKEKMKQYNVNRYGIDKVIKERIL